MKTFKALSALLNYPTAELQEAVGDIRQVLVDERLVEAETLEPLLTQVAKDGLFDLQSRYVDLFDRTPKLSLYLFEHIHGESRERGQAMVDLHELYRRHGLELDTRELPDYLPLFVEFLSIMPLEEARRLLAETVHILSALQQRLEEKGSPYAAILSALTMLAGLEAQPHAIAALRELPDATPELLDQEWEETPVTFGPECNQTGNSEQPIVLNRRRHH